MAIIKIEHEDRSPEGIALFLEDVEQRIRDGYLTGDGWELTDVETDDGEPSDER